MEIPNELYTVSSLFTFSGLATAVWIITSVLGYLVGIKKAKIIKKWFGLVLALVLALLGATLVENPTMLTWVVAVVNGFTIYLTAVGVNTVVDYQSSTARSKSPIKETAAEKARNHFTDLWF